MVFQNAHRLQVRYGIIAPVVLVNEYLQVRLRISDRKIFVVDVETYLLMALVGGDVRVPAHRSRDIDNRFYHRETGCKNDLVRRILVIDLDGIIAGNFKLDIVVRKQ